MLEKVIELKNVGVFEHHKAQGNIELRRLTLISAPNGCGKTTLVAVIRALRDRSIAPLAERYTLGATGGQSAHLRVAGADARFDGSKWTAQAIRLEIFDDEFVAKNVHGENGVETDHCRGLHTLVIGEEGAKIQATIVSLANDNLALNNQIAEAKAELAPHLYGLSTEAFLSLAELSDVNERIGRREGEVTAAEQQEKVQALLLLDQLPVPRFDTPSLGLLLRESIDSLSSDAALRVTTRISARLGSAGEQWLSTGIGFGADHDCPFCDQPTSHLSIVKDYKGFFSDAYKDLRRRVQEVQARTSSVAGDAAVSAVTTCAAHNELRLASWKTFYDVGKGLSSPPQFEAAAQRAMATLTALLRRKMDSPLEVVGLSEEDQAALDDFEKAIGLLEKYNEDVAGINAELTSFKAKCAVTDVGIAKSELGKLRATKARFLPEVAELCTRLEELLVKKEAGEEAKAAARKKLETYTAGIIKKYQAQINKYLSDFGASFRLDGMKEEYPGGKPCLGYGVVVRERAVAARTKEGVRFKTMLSGGDKRSLALAFFFARLDDSADLPDTIAVLDDPMCSLDRSRRAMTARRTIQLASRAKQVVLLSHDPAFLREVWDGTPHSVVPLSALQVESAASSATVRAWDIEKETSSELMQQIRSVEDYVNTSQGDPLSIKRMLRPLCETYVRHRRPKAFGPTQWIGDMIVAIKEAQPGSPLEALKGDLTWLSDVNEYTKDSHHGGQPGSAVSSPNPIELKTHCIMTLQGIGCL